MLAQAKSFLDKLPLNGLKMVLGLAIGVSAAYAYAAGVIDKVIFELAMTIATPLVGVGAAHKVLKALMPNE